MIVNEFDDLIVEKLGPNNIHLLPEFMDKCEQLGYNNNSSSHKLKLASMNPPNGQYWITLDYDGHVTGISGAHYFPEIGLKAWRVLFRLAVIPGHNKIYFCKNPILTSVNFNRILPMQINFAKDNGGEEFYITSTITESNIKSDKNRKLDQVVLPYLEKLGIIHLHMENVDLFHEKQNVWKIDLDRYNEYNIISNHRFFNKK